MKYFYYILYNYDAFFNNFIKYISFILVNAKEKWMKQSNSMRWHEKLEKQN